MSLFENDYFESSDEQLDLSEVGFKVHSSLIYKLGEELISDEITAISELIKNSYDADASFVELRVDPDYIEKDENLSGHNSESRSAIGKITIRDNGSGMDLKTIVDGWLTISNSFKKKMKKEKRTTPKYNRMPLGDKGLGRLSVQKLGRKMVLITKEEGSTTEYTVEIPWGDFQKNTTIENIRVSCSSKEVNKDNNGYTELIITDLVNIELWKKTQNIDELERELSKILSPFKDKNNTFFLSGQVGSRGLEFSQIENEVLNSALSHYYFRVNNNKITIVGHYKQDFFQTKNIPFEVSSDHIKEFSSLYGEKLEGFLFNANEENVVHFTQSFDISHISGLRSTELNGKTFYPGNFSGGIYSFYLDPSYLKELKFNIFQDTADYKEYVNQNKGVHVFRDDFRVQTDENDWLDITRSSATSGKRIDLKNDTIIGYVDLKAKDTYSLKEKTDRQGFIEDDYYYNFRLINQTIINRINRTRRKLNELFNQYAKNVVTDQSHDSNFPNHSVAVSNLKEVSKKSQEFAASLAITNSNFIETRESVKKIKQFVQTGDVDYEYKDEMEQIFNKLDSYINEAELTLKRLQSYLQELDLQKKQLDVIEDDYNIIVGQLEDITELAGLGLVAETVTHELFTLISNLKKNGAEIKKYISDKYNSDVKIDRFINYVLYTSDSLRKQISHLSPGFRNVRATKDRVSMSKLLNNHITHYFDRAKRKSIEIIFSGNYDFLVHVNIGMINQVLDNLYLNSEHWLQHAMGLKLINRGKYNLEVNSKGKLYVWDNGMGIDTSIENKVFEPFVTNKTNGRGLGLYIISRILNRHKCTIRLMRERNQFGNLYKFEVDFSKCITLEEEI